MSDRSGLGRRTVLQITGTTLGALSLAGTGVVRSESDYENVVDIVEAGADPNGNEPIDDVIDDYQEDDTLLKFPDGEYLANNLDFSNREHYELRATGDATLIPGPDYDVSVWIGGGSLRNFIFDGFTIDNTDDGHHPTIGFSAYDGLVVRDIHKKGYHDGENTAFSFSIWNEDGSGLVENLRMPDGGQPQTAVGVYVNTDGPLTFRNCHVEGFGNNGLYASNSHGPVHVEGGTFKNNDISQVRLGSAGSSVRNATISVENPPEPHDNSRGIRISDGPGPVRIEDCDIMVKDGQGGGGIVGAYSGGAFHVRDSRIYVGPDYSVIGSDGESTSFAVYVDEPTGTDQPGSRTFENVSITGGGEYRGAAIFRRDDNTLENVCVHQTGTERNGLVFTDQSDDNLVADSTIDVPAQPIVGEEDGVETRNVDHEGSCPMPEPMAEEDEEPSTSEPEEPAKPSESPNPADPRRVDQPTYAVMGNSQANPTATVYGNFKCPYTQAFVQGNLETIQQEFVETGRLNVQYRDLVYHPEHPGEPYLLDAAQNDLVSQVALGVWEFEPESYWRFFDCVFANQDVIDWTSLDDLTQVMKTAGVRNWGKVRVFVDVDWFEDPLHETTEDAGDLGVSFVPQLELDGDTIPPHHGTEEVVNFIESRL